MSGEESNPLRLNNSLENYNNSSPSLTGDLLFQQRIDRCLVAYHSASGLPALYCSASSLFIDLAFCLSPEEEKEIQSMLDICFHKMPNAVEGRKAEQREILKLTHKIMVLLTKKAHQKGFILQIIHESEVKPR